MEAAPNGDGTDEPGSRLLLRRRPLLDEPACMGVQVRAGQRQPAPNIRVVAGLDEVTDIVSH